MNVGEINVLLIQDNFGEANLIKKMLHHSSFIEGESAALNTTQVNNLAEAERHLQQHPCDIILLDISLQDSDALETIHQLKEDYPQTPLIVLSDQTNPQMLREAIQHGAQDILPKDALTTNLLIKGIHSTLERYRLLLELKSRASQLENQNLALNDFAHTVAHQIQGLLSQMVGYASLVDSHYQEELSQPAKQAVDQIMQSGYKMNNVITELLFLASMRSEDIEANALDTQRILKEVLKRLRYEIRATKAEIIMPDNWPTAMGYAPWIEEVWLNYMSNGLKYGSKENVRPILRLGATPEGNGMIRFWVADNGPGILKNDRKRLFKPHTRMTSKKIRGEGLGLSIVWRIIKKSGGKVGVDSEEGVGSCFWFTLPEAKLTS
ncbi:MAG: response regulator [Ardenticatenaceae bacterium]|nr:response regulator [Ardenticatenaceae bacterium]MCB8949740.1 response regulator [Ardenticatenaceae bacterium]